MEELTISTLIILRVNSGSGKTSVAKMLQRKIGRNTLVISQDVVRREMLWAHDGKDTAALLLASMELLSKGEYSIKQIIRVSRYLHSNGNAGINQEEIT